MGENVAGLHRRRITRQRGEGFWAQTLALRHVEHGEPLEERDCLGVLACLARLGLLCFGHETVGIDDHRALLALADIAARFQRLFEGEPVLRGVSAADGRAPRSEEHTSELQSLMRISY